MDFSQILLAIGQVLEAYGGKFAIGIAMLFGILLLIAYRKTVSHELEPVPVALTLFGLVETLVATIQKNPMPLMGFLVLTLFFFSSIAIIVIFMTQRRLTDGRIEDVLFGAEYRVSGNITQNALLQLEIYKWVKVGQGIIDVDIFPGAFMESTFGERAERRQCFCEVLPSTIFDKDKLLADEFLIPLAKRQALRRWYTAVSIVSLVAVIILIVFVI